MINNKLPNILNLLATLSLFSIICSISINSALSSAQAETMTNDEFRIEGGNFNSFSGSAQNERGQKVTFSSGETSANVAVGKNYQVRSGFQNISSTDSFTLSISTSKVSFGDLKPGEPITRTNTISVFSGSAPGFSVLASESHEPRVLPNGASIPDTTCDDGNCSETTSALWTSPLTYGFGYRCDDLKEKSCVSAFSNPENYRQFANDAKNETAQAVMEDERSNFATQNTITYKINVAQNQPSGLYQNTIQYIAVPNL